MLDSYVKVCYHYTCQEVIYMFKVFKLRKIEKLMRESCGRLSLETAKAHGLSEKTIDRYAERLGLRKVCIDPLYGDFRQTLVLEIYYQI